MVVIFVEIFEDGPFYGQLERVRFSVDFKFETLNFEVEIHVSVEKKVAFL